VFVRSLFFSFSFSQLIFFLGFTSLQIIFFFVSPNFTKHFSIDFQSIFHKQFNLIFLFCFKISFDYKVKFFSFFLISFCNLPKLCKYLHLSIFLKNHNGPVYFKISFVFMYVCVCTETTL
jgi:hypothetical protein